MYRYNRLPVFSYSRGAVAELSGAGSPLDGGMHDVRRAIMAPMLRLEEPDIECRSESCVLDEGLTGL